MKNIGKSSEYQWRNIYVLTVFQSVVDLDLLLLLGNLLGVGHSMDKAGQHLMVTFSCTLSLLMTNPTDESSASAAGHRTR